MERRCTPTVRVTVSISTPVLSQVNQLQSVIHFITLLYLSHLLLSWVGGWVFKIYLDDSRNNCFAGQTQAAKSWTRLPRRRLGYRRKELFPSHNNQILLLGIDLVWLLFPFYFWLRLDPIVTLRLVWLS